MKKIEIFTDGACSGNPGPGGWAAILKYKNNIKKISGFVPNTTNNRMEILALIKSLSILKESCEITVYSDSKYVIDSITKNWVLNWQKNNWLRKNTKVPNSDLWHTLLNLMKNHKINFIWVRGHSGHSENEECDKMAVNEIKNNKLILDLSQ
ncbi:MAG: ribonuclease HI [Clostridia bacterium]|nr:ribonuclease HI [Clostridia bacterium]